MNREQFERKYYQFIDWLRRHPITILMITFDPANDNKYHKYEASFDDVKFVRSDGIWRKTLTFKAKANLK